MDRIQFKVNGCKYTVGNEVSSEVMLLDYLREYLQLRGTKYMCRQAGCGACIVAAKRPDRRTNEAVNSCMVPITSCQNWEITTIEGVGNRNKGYHPLQKSLAANNGSQCGYCSPGWVMSMYSLLQQYKAPRMIEIEKLLGSNVCRCTGYRPILDAFKSFAKDAPKNLISDIEDLVICKKTGQPCDNPCDEEDWCLVNKEDADEPNTIRIELCDGRLFFKVFKISEILRLLVTENYDSYQLVWGNTARGAYPTDVRAQLLIDITGVNELKGYYLDQNLVINAGTTLTELMNIYKKLSEKEEDFQYLDRFYEHLEMVAHVAVRNLGCIAGNLMIKHQHNDFQSDLFVMFETVGAQLTLVTGQGKSRMVTMGEFLQTNMRGTVILNVMLPPLNKTYLVTTMKIMPKSQNAHAIVNAGFLYKLANNSIVTQARIVYNGISPTFVRALGTENFLIGKPLFKNETLQSALNILKKDLNATEMPPEPSPAYRQQLGLAMFYKGLLYFCPSNNINPRYLSGATFLRKARPLSRGEQNYETNAALWPLNQPIPKLESLIQCAGEAEYVDDIPSLPYEVFGAFVLSTVPLGQIASIDASEALKMKGVIAFYTAKDIPGKNSFIPKEEYNTSDEEILCSGDVKYYNQPLGIIVAELQHIAIVAAKSVKVKYTNIRKPVLDISDAIRDPKRNSILISIDATTRGHDTRQVVKGNATIYGQYHFSMEILVCVTLSTEEGLQVYPSVQNMDGVQAVISKALNLDANRIDIKVRRLGGSYGIKVTRSNQVAVSCSLVSFKLNRPCRFVLPLSTTTRAYGKRFPCIADMEAGINRSGIIQYLNFKLYEDNGYKVNEIIPSISRDVYNNCYEKSTWSFQCINTITDTAKNSWFRAPGTLEAVSFVELFMDRIAYEANLDPIELRLANLDPEHKDLREMLDTLMKESKYKERRKAVEIFNKNNRWLKKGLRFSFLKWASTIAPYFDVNISVYHVDGTVSLTHGGIEMGQGINTKAAQICAYFLKVPLEKVQVKATNTNTCPNSSITAGSFTILSIGIGVERSCKDLLQRLEPIRSKMPYATWQELIAKAFEENVDLQAHGFVNRNDVVAQKYNIYGITLSEVLIDVLTGEYEVLRVDILEDVGQSVSPEIDVGQIEGAFIMGLGYWTTERLVYDKKTGELLTDTSWTYYVPQARDIPQDMRVYFRKNSYSNRPSFGSKMTGEPPMCMTISVPLAIREAITSARRESGIPSTQWFDIDGPYNLESVCLSSATDIKDFKFY